MACWMRRSNTVGIPSSLTPPSGFSIGLRRCRLSVPRNRPPDRHGLERALQQAFPYLRPVSLQVDSELADFHVVHARRSLVLHHPTKGSIHVLPLKDRFHEADLSCRACSGSASGPVLSSQRSSERLDVSLRTLRNCSPDSDRTPTPSPAHADSAAAMRS